MNPWTIVVALLLAISLAGGGYYKGHKNGMNEQAVADQKLITAANQRAQGIIDGYNKQIADQKATANQMAMSQREEVIALQAERDKFKSQLGAKHAENQTLTRRLADAYAAYGLRFRTTIESGWCGDGAGVRQDSQGQSAGAPGTAVIQLPEALTRNLRQLVREADELNDDYKLCYGYVNKVDKAQLE